MDELAHQRVTAIDSQSQQEPETIDFFILSSSQL